MLRSNTIKIGGLLYVVAVFQFFIFELVAETLYPGYSVANNYISDLGATCVKPPSTLDCVIHQPSASIFNATVSLMGLMLLAGACFVYYGTRKKPYLVISAVAYVAIFLVGVLPENTGQAHVDVSFFLFPCVGISLLLSWAVVNGRIIRYLMVAFGAMTLFFTFTDVPARQVGVGGQERLLVLSALVGLLVLGGYLTGRDIPNAASTS